MLGRVGRCDKVGVPEPYGQCKDPVCVCGGGRRCRGGTQGRPGCAFTSPLLSFLRWRVVAASQPSPHHHQPAAGGPHRHAPLPHARSHPQSLPHRPPHACASSWPSWPSWPCAGASCRHHPHRHWLHAQTCVKGEGGGKAHMWVGGCAPAACRQTCVAEKRARGTMRVEWNAIMYHQMHMRTVTWKSPLLIWHLPLTSQQPRAMRMYMWQASSLEYRDIACACYRTRGHVPAACHYTTQGHMKPQGNKYTTTWQYSSLVLSNTTSATPLQRGSLSLPSPHRQPSLPPSDSTAA